MGLEERLAKKKREEYTHTATNSTSSNNSSGNRRRRHKIISGPVLSGQDKLQKKLNRLGKRGWVLVDTQRHSIGGKQHAVCFLRKDVNSKLQDQNDKLDEISDKLGRLLESREEE